MCIGEAPGRTEDEGGRPFIGEAGKEFNENYLRLAGLERDEIYITNSVHCRPDLNRKPGMREVAGCSAHFLPNEIDFVRPEVVILMGATACSLLGEGAVDLDVDHGVPRYGELFGWQGYVVPMYHPAAGMHDTSMMIPLLEDWTRLAPWLRDGAWQWAVDEFEGWQRDYALVKSPSDIYASVPYSKVFGIGFDTESHAGVDYSFQYSLAPGSARMVLLKDAWAVRDVVSLLNSTQRSEAGFIAMHNAPADLAIAERIGLKVVSLRDTMQEAYHLGNLKQALKALSRRILGRSRASWDEVVTPPSKKVLGEWMVEGMLYAEEHWRRDEVVVERDRVSGKTGKAMKDKVTRKVVKSVPETLLRELHGYTQTNPEYKVWEKLRDRMPVEWMDKLVSEFGPVPQRGIAYCEMSAAVDYACSDADDTLALALRFEQMRRDFVVELNVQERDRDVLVGVGGCK